MTDPRTPGPRDPPSFWGALKRRRVVRVAAAYAAIAFAALEGADLVLPRLGLPDGTLTVLVILAVLGFPLALALSWLFDRTPDGWVRTASEGSEVGAASHRRARLAALAVATAAFGLAAWWWIPRTPSFRTVEVDPNAIVVLPFEVRGSDDVAYLREGMLDLLGTKLDGVGGLRVVDPHTTLASLRDRDWDSPSVDEIAAAAAGLGAARALQGSIFWVGGTLQIRAAAYDVEDRSRVEATVEGPADELFGLVDRLVTELVAGGLLAADATLVGLENLTTGSNEALRAYLEAVGAYRRGEARAETYDQLLRAIELDSTFALAAFWAGEIAVWFEIPGATEHFEHANRHADRLPPRDRMRVSAALASSQGRYADALPLYAALIERYPEDLVGWFRYAEELAHSGMFAGRSLAEARGAYERAFALDPGMAPLYFHMAHIGGLQGDTASLRRWAAGLDSMNVDPLWPAVLRINEGLIRGDDALVAASAERYRLEETEIPAPVLAGSLGELVSGPLHLAPVRAVAVLEDFRNRALSDTARTVASRRLARLEAGIGRLRRARAVLEPAAASLGDLLIQDAAWIALHPAADDPAALGAAYDALAATSPASGTGVAAARHYLLGRLALRLDRPEAYRAARSALASMAPADPELARFAADLGHELAAVARLAAGDAEGGLDSLLDATYWRQKQGWLGFEPGTYFDGRMPDRHPMFLRAELLRAAGRSDEAVRWYEVGSDGPWHRGPALLALAAIASEAGAARRAEALHDRALSLWAEADDGVRARAGEARGDSSGAR